MFHVEHCPHTVPTFHVEQTIKPATPTFHVEHCPRSTWNRASHVQRRRSTWNTERRLVGPMFHVEHCPRSTWNRPSHVQRRRSTWNTQRRLGGPMFHVEQVRMPRLRSTWNIVRVPRGIHPQTCNSDVPRGTLSAVGSGRCSTWNGSACSASRA